MHRVSRFKAAMASFPSGVVVATTIGPRGEPRGFTATAFTSVSVDPMMVLICLGKSAECFPSFADASRFAVSILAAEQEDIARLLATRGADKFSGGRFRRGAHGLYFVRDAVATLTCRKAKTCEGGDHHVLLAEVEDIEVTEDREAMVFYRRRFLNPARPDALQTSR